MLYLSDFAWAPELVTGRPYPKGGDQPVDLAEGNQLVADTGAAEDVAALRPVVAPAYTHTRVLCHSSLSIVLAYSYGFSI